MIKIKRSILIAAALTVYLIVMASIGWKQYAAGAMTATYYFGVLAASIAAIVLLYFSLRRRERLRREREQDMAAVENEKSNHEQS